MDAVSTSVDAPQPQWRTGRRPRPWRSGSPPAPPLEERLSHDGPPQWRWGARGSSEPYAACRWSARHIAPNPAGGWSPAEALGPSRRSGPGPRTSTASPSIGASRGSGSSNFEVADAARHLEGKAAARSIALDAVQPEITAAADKVRRKARCTNPAGESRLPACRVGVDAPLRPLARLGRTRSRPPSSGSVAISFSGRMLRAPCPIFALHTWLSAAIARGGSRAGPGVPPGTLPGRSRAPGPPPLRLTPRSTRRCSLPPSPGGAARPRAVPGLRARVCCAAFVYRSAAAVGLCPVSRRRPSTRIPPSFRRSPAPRRRPRDGRPSAGQPLAEPKLFGSGKNESVLPRGRTGKVNVLSGAEDRFSRRRAGRPGLQRNVADSAKDFFLARRPAA